MPQSLKVVELRRLFNLTDFDTFAVRFFINALEDSQSGPRGKELGEVSSIDKTRSLAAPKPQATGRVLNSVTTQRVA